MPNFRDLLSNFGDPKQPRIRPRATGTTVPAKTMLIKFASPLGNLESLND